jgi:hypothetical protein
MHAVYVVAIDDVEDDGDGVRADGGLAGIHPQMGAVLSHELGMGDADVIARRGDRADGWRAR